MEDDDAVGYYSRGENNCVQTYNAATTHEGRSAYKFVPCKARASKDHWKKSSIHEPVSDLEDLHTLLRTN